MMTFTAQDVVYMQMALELAEKGQFTTTPNPSVGCVLVKDGKIVGRGFHFKAGEPHAEVMALREAGEAARGATAYVTLEPCSHFGRTPPCAKGLIEAGVVKVISAMCDPNPQVAGSGLKMLADMGIESAVGLLEEKAEWLNRGFLKRMRTGKPYVQLKMAMSLDGRTAMASGESKWITGELARADVQAERAKASAILSTSATVLADDPLLNVRWQQLSEKVKAEYALENVRQPVRVILDSQHSVQPTHQLFQCASPVWLVSQMPRSLIGFPSYCEHIQLAPSRAYLSDLMTELGQRQINTLWIEAGATLAGALIEAKLVDELIIYIAPKLLGDEARGLCKLPHLTRLADASAWQLHSIEKMGEDIKAIYHPRMTEPTC
ncbi:bifunctional diaminohydroxyphosphoribosylaminopyrimidine deaminase/5-amino-6-(5-phosphoribosylamino)uracil reductase RibD [Bisgaard Taxon 45]